MASGRFVSTSIAEDDKLSRLSMTAELIYLKTIPHLDRDGMISGKPGLLFSKVCPLREELFGETKALIDEWVAVGLVIRFMCDEGPVLFFPGFAKNNNLPHYERERPSRFPAPPGYYRAERGIFKDGTTPPEKKPKADTDTPPQDVANIQEPVQEQVLELVPILGTEEQEEDQDQVKEQIAATQPARRERAPTPQQELFGAVCEAIGWDYKTLSKDDKGQVAQAVGILQKANYTVADIRTFMTTVWFNDWRWKDKAQHPTLKQLRQEIGKIRSLVAEAAPPKATGIDGFREMLAQQGIQL